MALILCIETSSKACSVALADNGVCVAYKEILDEWQHSRRLTLLIEESLKGFGVELKGLAAVAISRGPGSYTGLRVGASCGKGLCYALDIPLISIPTLELIAQEHIKMASEETLIIPMIDARRMEVYYNVYDSLLTPQQETTNLVLEAASFERYKGQKLLFCGDGAFKMENFVLDELWSILPSIASASYMTALAQRYHDNADHEDIAYYVPFYLKPPNITKSKKALF